MTRKRIAAIVGLSLFLLLITALIYVVLFDPVQKQSKIMAILFTMIFFSIFFYALSLITRYLRQKNEK